MCRHLYIFYDFSLNCKFKLLLQMSGLCLHYRRFQDKCVAEIISLQTVMMTSYFDKTALLHLEFLHKIESELFVSSFTNITERLCEHHCIFLLSFFFPPFPTTVCENAEPTFLLFPITDREFPNKSGLRHL